jgi:hypothetical protein
LQPARQVARGYRAGRRDLLDARIIRAALLAGRGDHARATDEASAQARQTGLTPVNLDNIACVFGRSSAAAANDGKLSPADRTQPKAQYAYHPMEFLHQAVAEGFRSRADERSGPRPAALARRLSEAGAQDEKVGGASGRM